MGDSPLAAEFRRLLAAGAVPGWELHPVPGGRTPLNVLAGPLHRLSGSVRFYNLLEREGFAWVEEVAATPDGCLLELRNSGMKLITAVRQVLADRGLGGAPATAGSLAAPDDPGRDPDSPAGTAGCPRRRPGRCRSWPRGRLRSTARRCSGICSRSLPA